MKKTLLLLSAVVLLGACSAEDNGVKRPSLESIFADAKEKAEFSLQREENKELKDEDLAQWENIKAETKIANDYLGTDNIVTNSMLIGAYMAEELGYSPADINKYLKVDLYVDNPYCDDEFSAFEVVKVTDNYAIARGCKEVTTDEACRNPGTERRFVFPKQIGDRAYLYFDNQILQPEQGQCVIYVSTFKYADKDGEHTVPVATFESKKLMSPKFLSISASRLDVIDERGNK